MSKLNIGIAVIVLATVLSAAGYAAAKGGGGGHGGGGHGGGGHGGGHHGGGHGGAHFGGGGHRGGHFGSHANFGGGGRHTVRNMRSGSVRNALSSRALSRTLRNTAALRNPNIRARVAAGAAMAGWYYGRNGSGWWQHSNGGYGWVGPLFWPFAYFDIYDYAMWGSGFGAPFWGYGYDDIYAGMFAPYAYDDLAGYLPPRVAAAGPSNAAPDRLAQMCGDDSRDIAGLPIDLIQQAIEPTETQRAALDELANASVTAAQTIKAACPTGLSLTAPSRLGSMQQRIEAMIAAVATVQPSLDKFYSLLNDEQKVRLNALGDDQRRRIAARRHDRSLAQSCDVAQPAALQWQIEEIDARLRPTDAQRASLVALQDSSAKAADMLKTSCQASDAITPPARLAAIGKRLDTMLQAIKLVRSALNDFYGTLSDEQKAQFEAIGPQRTALSDQPDRMQKDSRRHRRELFGN